VSHGRATVFSARTTPSAIFDLSAQPGAPVRSTAAGTVATWTCENSRTSSTAPTGNGTESAVSPRPWPGWRRSSANWLRLCEREHRRRSLMSSATSSPGWRLSRIKLASTSPRSSTAIGMAARSARRSRARADADYSTFHERLRCHSIWLLRPSTRPTCA